MKGYEKAARYWDKYFEGTQEYDPNDKMDQDAVEQALEWLSSKDAAIVDFGCGHGKLLLRCLELGAGRIYGIDISGKAVARAKRIVKRAGMENRAVFVKGGLDKLRALGEDTFDAGILTGILDNLAPEDGVRMLKLTHRAVKPGGKVILLINPHIGEGFIGKLGLNKKAENFYENEEGLFLWNLSDEELTEILVPYFKIESSTGVDFGSGMENRLLRLINR
jgi:ubiquinone/menaquinone biosynthesis C-methylase UbiE